MRRWVKLREHFDKRPREEKKTVVSIIN